MLRAHRRCTDQADVRALKPPFSWREQQGRLKICSGRSWRACQRWVWSAGLTAPDARQPFRYRRGVRYPHGSSGPSVESLRRGSYRSIRQGFRELTHDSKGMLALGGVETSAGTISGIRAAAVVPSMS